MKNKTGKILGILLIVSILATICLFVLAISRIINLEWVLVGLIPAIIFLIIFVVHNLITKNKKYHDFH